MPDWRIMRAVNGRSGAFASVLTWGNELWWHPPHVGELQPKLQPRRRARARPGGCADNRATDRVQPPTAAPRPRRCSAAQGTAEHAELAEAAARLTDASGYRAAATDPLAPLARDIARNHVAGGFALHHCARTHPATGSAASACCAYPSMCSGRP